MRRCSYGNLRKAHYIPTFIPSLFNKKAPLFEKPLCQMSSRIWKPMLSALNVCAVIPKA
jgi:hypothetical protein